METAKKDLTQELGDGKILPLVFRLTIPAVVAQLITFLYNIVDRMYVAKIEGTGMDALAALGVVLPITLIMQAFANLVGLGGAPRAGIKLGENDRAEADCIFNTAFVLLLITGIILGVCVFVLAKPIVVLFGCPPSAVGYAVSYLKIYSCGTLFVMLAQGLNPFVLTQGYSVFAMCSVLLGAIINIILDPILIFALGMGVSGSSLATVISQLCSCICVICFFFSKKSLFHFCAKNMRLLYKRVMSVVSLGFTPFIMTITECAIQVVFNVNLNRATGGNKDYTAALTIMLSALQLISLPLNGLGNGMQPFVSFNYGRGNAERPKKGIGTSARIACDFQYRLTEIGLSAFFFTDVANMRVSALNIREGDAAIGISNSGRTAATADALALACEHGAKTVCVTSYPKCELVKNSDYPIVIKTDEIQYPTEGISARIAHISVLDSLAVSLSAKDFDRAVRRSAKIHDLIDELRY